MKTRIVIAALAAHLGLGATLALGAASQAQSALTSPQQRQAAVDLATRLTREPEPTPLPEELKNPFNPPDFTQADPAAPRGPAAPGGAAPAAPSPVAPAGPAADRDILETLAQRIPSQGTMLAPGNRTLLLVGTGPTARRLQVGDVFTVTYNNQDYDLALVAIASTTFTLRYRNEEITRPIKSK
jgi:hypothetical protein